jgi:hypothetical protein
MAGIDLLRLLSRVDMLVILAVLKFFPHGRRPVNYDLTVLPTPEMEMNTFGLTGALMTACTRDCVVLTRLAHTFFLKPGVHRLVGSRTFCPARLTTATVLAGKPESARSV